MEGVETDGKTQVAVEEKQTNAENGEATCTNQVVSDRQAAHPEVKFRNKKSNDSASERKRRSKNRLSNRRSTGIVAPEEVEKAREYVDFPETISNNSTTNGDRKSDDNDTIF